MSTNTELPKVNILLAVYNGEKHLKKQLDSLCAQTYDNIDIYIRDDGSTDDSVAFIKKYMGNNESNKNIFFLEATQNLKCPGSFYEIAKKCKKAKYYAFCDQDDYWKPEKIQWAVEKLEEKAIDKPLVYFSACEYVTSEGEFIRKSPIQNEKTDLEDTLFYTPGSGFTIVFNEAARQKLILEINPGTELHDKWMIRGAVCLGETIYDKRITASHIRHEVAVTAGDSDNLSLLLHFIKKELFGPEVKKDKKNLKYFYETFYNELTEKEHKVFDLFTYDRFHFFIWLKKIFYPRRLRKRLSGEIVLRVLFLLGRM